MEDFYKGLGEGLGIADALRRAQLARIEKGEHPYYWAPVVISGDFRPIREYRALFRGLR